jgi:hypothetical protein
MKTNPFIIPSYNPLPHFVFMEHWNLTKKLVICGYMKQSKAISISALGSDPGRKYVYEPPRAIQPPAR